MTYLLDTNTISELSKPAASPNVLSWLAQVPEERAYLSIATIAEIRRGIELLPFGRRREQLRVWFEVDLSGRFHGRILDIDRAVAEAWGVVMGRAKRLGASLSVMDGFFAATAEVHGLTRATRNTRQFDRLGIPLFDPWSYDASTG